MLYAQLVDTVLREFLSLSHAQRELLTCLKEQSHHQTALLAGLDIIVKGQICQNLQANVLRDIIA